jgi:hypothetical protein
MEDLAVYNIPEDNIPVGDVPMTFSALFQSMPDEYNGNYQDYLNTYGDNNATAVELLRMSSRTHCLMVKLILSNRKHYHNRTLHGRTSL